MTWVPKSSMLLEIDKPARSKDITAIFDNSEAMANGDFGAPKIQQAALDPSVSVIAPGTTGTAFAQKSMGQLITVNTDVAKYLTNATTTPRGVAVFTAFVGTSLTITGISTTTDATSTLDIYKNNNNTTAIASLTLPNGASQPITLNATLAKGDTLWIEVTGNGVVQTFLDNIFIKTGNNVTCGG